MLQTAVLDVRLLPWRPRARVMRTERVRDGADPLVDVDDLAGIVLGLALWLLIIIAAPLIVLVLAVLLFSVELPIVIALALLLLVVRFTGLLPWTVTVVDQVSGQESHETYRSIWRATRRVRDLNSDRKVKVRWAWS